MMSVIVTTLVSSLLFLVVKPVRGLASYQRRTVRWPRPDSELRILACIHTTRNVPTLIALLDASNPSRRSPISLFPLHLIELTARASAMFIIHTATSKDSSSADADAPHRSAHSDHIMHAFETYEQHAAGVSVHPLTAVSPYPTMHQDVSGAAEDHRAALIILPFHMNLTVDGDMVVTNPAIRSLNQNVLSSAPCSVAVLVDRGLRNSAAAAYDVLLIFLGGPDDREALALAARMAEHPATSLTVLRFLPAADRSPKAQRVLNVGDGNDERRMDEECLSDFRLRNVSDESVVYAERLSSNAEETVAAIREMMHGVHDLYIVGRRGGMESPLTAGLTEWSECPELGPIGDLFASADFGATVSVLVVQQGAAAGGGGGGGG